MASTIPSNLNLSDSPTTNELATVLKTLVTDNRQLREELDSVRNENERLHGELESLREELESVRHRAGRDRAELSSRVTELEESAEESSSEAQTDDPEADSPDANPGEQMAEPTVPDAETALEDTLRLPEPVAEDSLSANQARARSVARDIGDYAEYNHQYGNYSLTAKRLRIVLKAQSDDETAAHHETVKRVRNFLDRLGESEVSITEDRGGTKRLVFAESLVDRIEAYQAHGGVRGETMGTGVKS
jgi:regulator of replication initiation timing